MDILHLPHRKYGEERTQSGSYRFQFRYGILNKSFVACKFFQNKTVIDPPMCIIVSFTISNFVQSVNDVGLKLTAKEIEQLKQEKIESLS